MKKLLFIVCLSSILFACNGVKTYTINGTMPDSLSNNSKIFLFDYALNSIIDSCVVVDSKFTFKGTATDSLPILRVDNRGRSPYYANFVMEPGVINIDMDRKSKIYGAPLNESFVIFKSSIDSVKQIFTNKVKTLTDQSEIDATMVEAIAITDEIVKKHIAGNEKNPLGLFIAWQVMNGSTGIEQPTLSMIDSYINSGGEIIKNFKPILDIRENIVNKEKTAVGRVFTDVDAKNPDDSPAKLSDYVGKGKYVLVDFWASWCGPCKAELPVIKEVYNTYKDKGLVVLGFNVWDTKANFEKSIVELEMPWSQIYESESTKPTNYYGINGIPHIILFAPDGTIAARGLRGDGLKAKVAEVFAAKK